MLLRTVVIAASLTFASPLVLAQAPTPATAPKPLTIGDLFAAANADAAAIPQLILGASATMSTLPPDKARLLGDSVEPYLERAFFSPERFPGMERLGLVLHKVAKGENPTKIAQRYKIGAQMLAFLNEDFDERKMRVGLELKVLDLSNGALAVSVTKSLYRVAAWRELPSGGRTLVMYATAGIGALESPTPVGKTTIQNRVLNPQWTDPVTKETFAPNDPGNVLGGYWIALDAAGLGRNGIGFHGYTGAPAQDWIAKPASHGCVRMLQRDIDRLYHLAIEGTPVTIAE